MAKAKPEKLDHLRALSNACRAAVTIGNGCHNRKQYEAFATHVGCMSDVATCCSLQKIAAMTVTSSWLVTLGRRKRSTWLRF